MKKELQSNFKTVREVVGEAYKNLIEQVDSVKIPFWKNFNHATGGFRPREFSILCGSTGVGKTTFIANMSADLLRQDIPHYVASVETGHIDFVRRVTSALVNEDLNTGERVSVDRIKTINSQHGSKLNSEKLCLGLYENRTSVEQLMHDIRVAHEKYKVKIAIIDNLNFFMEVTKSSDTIIEMDRVVHEMIIFCKTIDVHIIMVMHPKKSGDPRDTRVESEFEIKGSSLAVQESHNIFLLNRIKKDDLQSGSFSETDRELKIAKMRRRGRAVGRKIFFSTNDGVSYHEKGFL